LQIGDDVNSNRVWVNHPGGATNASELKSVACTLDNRINARCGYWTGRYI